MESVKNWKLKVWINSLLKILGIKYGYIFEFSSGENPVLIGCSRFMRIRKIKAVPDPDISFFEFIKERYTGCNDYGEVIIEGVEEEYSEKQLIEFGNYLLSDRRQETVFENGDAKIVHHADLQNFFNK